VVRPRGDVLVATSMTRPFMVVFVLIVRGEDGGDLVVVQGPQGWYSEWDIVTLRALRSSARRRSASATVKVATVKLEHP